MKDVTLKDLIECGIKPADMARELGISDAAVTGWKNKGCIPKRSQKRVKEILVKRAS